MNVRRIAVAALLALAVTAPAHAQMFLDIDTIPGDAVADPYQNWIEIESFQQSVANVNNTPVFFPLTLTKQTDKSTPLLVQAAILGTNLGTVTVEVSAGTALPPTRMGLVEYFKLELLNAKVVEVSTAGAAGDTLFESVTLTCTGFTMSYQSLSSGPSPITTSGSCGN